MPGPSGLDKEPSTAQYAGRVSEESLNNTETVASGDGNEERTPGSIHSKVPVTNDRSGSNSVELEVNDSVLHQYHAQQLQTQHVTTEDSTDRKERLGHTSTLGAQTKIFRWGDKVEIEGGATVEDISGEQATKQTNEPQDAANPNAAGVEDDNTKTKYFGKFKAL